MLLRVRTHLHVHYIMDNAMLTEKEKISCQITGPRNRSQNVGNSDLQRVKGVIPKLNHN